MTSMFVLRALHTYTLIPEQMILSVPGDEYEIMHV